MNQVSAVCRTDGVNNGICVLGVLGLESVSCRCQSSQPTVGMAVGLL